jgi:hypothetical protein
MATLTPYVTPETLVSAETGISFKTVPYPGASATEQLAEQLRICWRATHRVDQICNQTLRATINQELLRGPHLRLQVDPSSGVARVIASRWPILQVLGAQFAPAAAVSPTWTPIPLGAITIVHTGLNTYGTDTYGAAGAGPAWVQIAPGYLNWLGGRNGYLLQLTYVNGWPHAGLTASVAAGATTLPVDDCTGWVGATGWIKDGANSEQVTVTQASAQSGPGTLTLAAAIQNSHAAGLAVTTMPWSIEWATILLAATIALTRGGTATTVQAMPGSLTGGGKSTEELLVQAEEILATYRRVI